MKNSSSTLNRLLKKLAEEGEKSFLAGSRWRVIYALKRLKEIHPELKIDEILTQKIIEPSRIIETLLPVEYQGKTYFCLGVRAWFDNGQLHKPGEIVKGGIRFLSVKGQIKNQSVTIIDQKKARELMLEDVSALGLEMLAKNAGTNFVKNILQKFNLIKKNKNLVKLAIVGGAKGVIIAPRSLHLSDHNQFARETLKVFGYKLGLMGIVGWDRDVPAGDIGTTGVTASGSVLDGFIDGYQMALKDLNIRLSKHLLVGVITGKTANQKYLGNPARATATGFGTVEALKIWVESKKRKLGDLRVVFDGAGNAALPAAKFLVNQGIKVIGMTDSRSVIIKQEGLNVQDLDSINLVKSKRGSLADWAKNKKAVKILSDKIKLWQDSGMNVLFVSSDAMIINVSNVDKLPKGILIIDGANGPVTPKAEMKLPGRNIEHLTGSYANAGGVIGSLIEWLANVADITISKEEAERYIAFCMRENFREMEQLVSKRTVGSLAEAFYYMAMQRFLQG